MRTQFFLLLLFATVMVTYVLACQEQKNINIVDLDYPTQICEDYGCRYTYTREETSSSTIICSNITSLKDISYTYNEKTYDQYLKITNSNITTIQALDLQQFSTIIKLNLNNLQIQQIIPGAFTGLTRLKELYLNDNQLSELSNGVYNSFHKLEILNLSNNYIHHIADFSLHGLASLRKFYLENNNLAKIEKGTLDNLHHLQHLDVSDNPLQEFPFLDVPNVEILNLARSDLESFDEDLSSFNLKELDLSNCQMTNINFTLFPKLDKIDLSGNQIESLENCQDLDAVDVRLDNNSISIVDGNFSGISRFSMSNNSLEILQKIFSDTLLLRLDLSYNEISKIDQNSFRGLVVLQDLYLNHNQIKKIDPNLLRDLTKLTLLDLSHNQIESFQYGTFDSLKNLKTLEISHNQLLSLNEHTFHSLVSLKHLYFDANKISSIDVSFIKYLRSLSTVSLDNNLWNCKDLLRLETFLKMEKVEIIKGFSYEVENFHGIACTNPKNFLNSSTTKTDVAPNNVKTVPIVIKNTEIDNFFNRDFKNSKFVQFFDQDYSKSNFFKYLNDFKYTIVKQEHVNDSKVEKLTSFQVTPNGGENKIFIFGVFLLCVITVLLVINMYLKMRPKKRSKSESMAQIELC